MKRKVYVSVLGTGNYNECVYTKVEEEFKSSSVRFVQEATIEYWKCNEWTENDVMYFLLTDGSRKKNWQDRNPEDGTVIHGLESCLKEMNIVAQIKPLLISDGSNESEIMDIFSTLYNGIEDGDDFYVDLTHGFRYLPMLILVFCNYAKFLKNVTCENLVYGNWESRNKSNEAPLIDLYPLVYLQQWTIASENFINSGNTDKLQAIVTNRLKKFKGMDFEMRNINPIMSYLNELVGELVTCQGYDLIKANAIDKLRKELSDSKDMPKPFIPLIDKIKNSFYEFNSYKDEVNGIKAAKWCFDHKLYQQAVTMAQESAITYICKIYGLEWANIKDRKMVSNLIYNYSKTNEGEPWTLSRIEPEHHQQSIERLDKMKKDVLLSDLCNIVNVCTELRNQYNHGGMLENKKFNSSKMISKIKQIIDGICHLCIQNEVCHPYFINISNHPFENWDENQIAAAKEYGDLIEIPFPTVPTDADHDEIEIIADNILKQTIEASHSILSSTVHVMGEMTLTYSLVSKLTEYGFNCVASTTKRVTEDMDDGTKLSKFVFAKFRKYN